MGYHRRELEALGLPFGGSATQHLAGTARGVQRQLNLGGGGAGGIYTGGVDKYGQPVNPLQSMFDEYNRAQQELHQLKQNQYVVKESQKALNKNPEYVEASEYTKTRRPGYQPFGPNTQFYQPIYQPKYTDYAPQGPQGPQQGLNPVSMAAGIPGLLQAMRPEGARDAFVGSPFAGIMQGRDATNANKGGDGG